jgi:cell wall-associated NlpC family hydrolase
MSRWASLLLAAVAMQACSPFSGGRGSISRLEDGSFFFGDPSGNPKTYQALLAQFQEWRGTPYLLGGNSKAGIDCSAFVQQTLADRFNIDVPRTTIDQVETGIEIHRSKPQIGDLLFFRTGYSTRHVGIYIGNRQFMHASTKAGVTVNSLDEAYWTKTFWTIRRVM